MICHSWSWRSGKWGATPKARDYLPVRQQHRTVAWTTRCPSCRITVLRTTTRTVWNPHISDNCKRFVTYLHAKAWTIRPYKVPPWTVRSATRFFVKRRWHLGDSWCNPVRAFLSKWHLPKCLLSSERLYMPNFQPKISVHFKLAANCTKDIWLTEKM